MSRVVLWLCLMAPAISADNSLPRQKWTDRCVRSLERARRDLGWTGFHVKASRFPRAGRWPATEAVALYEKDPQAPKVYLLRVLESECAYDQDWRYFAEDERWIRGMGCTMASLIGREGEPSSPRLRHAVEECLTAPGR